MGSAHRGLRAVDGNCPTYRAACRRDAAVEQNALTVQSYPLRRRLRPRRAKRAPWRQARARCLALEQRSTWVFPYRRHRLCGTSRYRFSVSPEPVRRFGPDG